MRRDDTYYVGVGDKLRVREGTGRPKLIPYEGEVGRVVRMANGGFRGMEFALRFEDGITTPCFLYNDDVEVVA